MLKQISSFILPVFMPLGFFSWGTVASLISGFVAKEMVISTIGIINKHKNKNGTPTMGGLAFIAAAVVAAAIFIGYIHPKIPRTPILCLAVGLSYMVIGLLDDFLKKHRKENLGLRPWQKLVFQTFVATFCGIYAYRAGLTKAYLPFFNRSIELGVWGIPLVIFVFLGTVNAVNLTDGLDGLAAGVSAPFFATLGTMILLQKGDGSLSMISFCLVGALLAYLLFNVPPAAVVMGDTGSLSLGGFAAGIAVFSGNAFYLIVIGFCFVLSVISVIMQVIY